MVKMRVFFDDIVGERWTAWFDVASFHRNQSIRTEKTKPSMLIKMKQNNNSNNEIKNDSENRNRLIIKLHNVLCLRTHPRKWYEWATTTTTTHSFSAMLTKSMSLRKSLQKRYLLVTFKPHTLSQRRRYENIFIYRYCRCRCCSPLLCTKLRRSKNAIAKPISLNTRHRTEMIAFNWIAVASRPFCCITLFSFIELEKEEKKWRKFSIQFLLPVSMQWTWTRLNTSSVIACAWNWREGAGKWKLIHSLTHSLTIEFIIIQRNAVHTRIFPILTTTYAQFKASNFISIRQTESTSKRKYGNHALDIHAYVYGMYTVHAGSA